MRFLWIFAHSLTGTVSQSGYNYVNYFHFHDDGSETRVKPRFHSQHTAFCWFPFLQSPSSLGMRVQLKVLFPKGIQRPDGHDAHGIPIPEQQQWEIKRTPMKWVKKGCLVRPYFMVAAISDSVPGRAVSARRLSSACRTARCWKRHRSDSSRRPQCRFAESA